MIAVWLLPLHNYATTLIYKDRVYVIDLGNNRIQVFDKNGNFTFLWGGFGTENGEFNEPRGIAINHDRVYVADTGNNRVQIFNFKGQFLFSYGRYGSEPGEFNEPYAIVVDQQGYMYVVDKHNNRVQKFDMWGNFVHSWGTYGSYSGQFAEPVDISLANDQLFVSDLVNHRIQVFDTSGNFLYQWARHPIMPREGNGRVHYPMSLAASPTGRFVVVCESFENRCQVFDVETIRKGYIMVNDSAWWTKYPLFHYGRRLKIALEQQKIVMSEPDIHEVVVFDIRGDRPSRTARLGGFGVEPGKFNGPHGVGISPQGEIFITDTFNHRVQVFDLDGKLLRMWGKFGSGPGEFNAPSSGSAPTLKFVFIGDTRNHRVQVFGWCPCKTCMISKWDSWASLTYETTIKTA